MHKYKLSVVVISYNMARELPRTIRSLSPSMQRDIEKAEYEIIVIDNGSSRPPLISEPDVNLTIESMPNPCPSPVAAINRGIALASGEIIGVIMDGARMVTPGLLAGVLRAARLHHRPVIATLSFHLGPDLQDRSPAKGYNQEVEDKLLENSRWEEDGYRLFDISVFAGSSQTGWFMSIPESNALFLPRCLWDELGGFDQRFASVGGGLVNLDTYVRSCGLPDSQLIVLLGEGTFHQIHGGVSSNAKVSRWPEFHEEYVRLRGHDFARPQVSPLYVGRLPPQVLPFIEQSAILAQHKLSLPAAMSNIRRRLRYYTLRFRALLGG